MIVLLVVHGTTGGDLNSSVGDTPILTPSFPGRTGFGRGQIYPDHDLLTSHYHNRFFILNHVKTR